MKNWYFFVSICGVFGTTSYFYFIFFIKLIHIHHVFSRLSKKVYFGTFFVSIFREKILRLNFQKFLQSHVFFQFSQKIKPVSHNFSFFSYFGFCNGKLKNGHFWMSIFGKSTIESWVKIKKPLSMFYDILFFDKCNIKKRETDNQSEKIYNTLSYFILKNILNF